jgi:hypothetical protein
VQRGIDNIKEEKPKSFREFVESKGYNFTKLKETSPELRPLLEEYRTTINKKGNLNLEFIKSHLRSILKYKKMAIPIAAIIVLILSWTVIKYIVAPGNTDDCILKYQKKAKCNAASRIVNIVCECKFDKVNNMNLCQRYSDNAMDCILKNIGDAQTDLAAKRIAIACLDKYPGTLSDSPHTQ